MTIKMSQISKTFYSSNKHMLSPILFWVSWYFKRNDNRNMLKKVLKSERARSQKQGGESSVSLGLPRLLPCTLCHGLVDFKGRLTWWLKGFYWSKIAKKSYWLALMIKNWGQKIWKRIKTYGLRHKPWSEHKGPHFVLSKTQYAT